MTTSPLHRKIVVNVLVRGKIVILCKIRRLGPYKYPIWHVWYDHEMNIILYTTLSCLKCFDDCVNCVTWLKLFT
jgi:hypothetical protein